MSGDGLRLLGQDAGGCTVACSEMHTFSWPCEQALMPVEAGAPTRQELLVIATAVVGVLMWLACAVMAIENVRGEAPQLPHTSDAGTPAVIYGEDTTP